MTPDEAMLRSFERSAIGRVHAECGTCEGEGAVVAQERFPLLPHRDGVRVASSWLRHCLSMYGERVVWQIDTCPECGRGREAGRL